MSSQSNDSWMAPKGPYTGTGDKPKNSLPAKVTVVMRDKDGKVIK